MRKMTANIYRDYWVVVNPARTSSGKYAEAFSIHPLSDGSADTNVVAYQISISQAHEADTEHEAIENAMKHAGTWIDAQLE